MRTEGHLFKKVSDFENIFCALMEAGGSGRRWYNPEYMRLIDDIPGTILDIQEDLRHKSLIVSPTTAFTVWEPKKRDVTAPHIRDVIIQNSALHYMNPVFYKKFIPFTYACISGRGQLKSVNQLQRMMRQASAMWPHGWYMGRFDFAGYFANIDHGWLDFCLRRTFSDKNILWLIWTYLKSFDNRGLALGSPLSQPLANLNATPLDHLIMDQLGVSLYCRYMDDGRYIVETRDQAEDVMAIIDNFVTRYMNQELSAKKTMVIKGAYKDTFCGYVCFPHHLEAKIQTMARARRRLKKKTNDYLSHTITLEQYLDSIGSYKAILDHTTTKDPRVEAWLKLAWTIGEI